MLLFGSIKDCDFSRSTITSLLRNILDDVIVAVVNYYKNPNVFHDHVKPKILQIVIVVTLMYTNSVNDKVMHWRTCQNQQTR